MDYFLLNQIIFRQKTSNITFYFSSFNKIIISRFHESQVNRVFLLVFKFIEWNYYLFGKKKIPMKNTQQLSPWKCFWLVAFLFQLYSRVCLRVCVAMTYNSLKGEKKILSLAESNGNLLPRVTVFLLKTPFLL